MNYISYISIGSNLGNRLLNCKCAINELMDCSELLKMSSFYETEPWGYEDNNQYKLNNKVNLILEDFR